MKYIVRLQRQFGVGKRPTAIQWTWLRQVASSMETLDYLTEQQQEILADPKGVDRDKLITVNRERVRLAHAMGKILDRLGMGGVPTTTKLSKEEEARAQIKAMQRGLQAGSGTAQAEGNS